MNQRRNDKSTEDGEHRSEDNVRRKNIDPPHNQQHHQPQDEGGDDAGGIIGQPKDAMIFSLHSQT